MVLRCRGTFHSRSLALRRPFLVCFTMVVSQATRHTHTDAAYITQVLVNLAAHRVSTEVHRTQEQRLGADLRALAAPPFQLQGKEKPLSRWSCPHANRTRPRYLGTCCEGAMATRLCRRRSVSRLAKRQSCSAEEGLHPGNLEVDSLGLGHQRQPSLGSGWQCHHSATLLVERTPRSRSLLVRCSQLLAEDSARAGVASPELPLSERLGPEILGPRN